MAVQITMPRLSDSMEEGTVAKWLVDVGQEVKRGQVLVEIDTDKATMEYEAEVAGTVLQIIVPEGETASIGAAIAWVGAPGESAPASPASPAASAPVATAPAAAAAAPAAPAAARPAGGRANASPVARRLAAELGVDLSSLQGSGPGGQITKEDVERAGAAGVPAVAPLEHPVAEKGEVTLVEPTRVQHLIAKRMVEGGAVPTFAVESEIDMTRAVAFRRDLSEAQDPPPSLNDFVVRAAALTLREFPRMNAAYAERGFELFSRVNVGIAVATDEALLVPTIFDADEKPLATIASEARAIAAKVRDGTVTAHELEGGTFTITNLGMFGASRFLPIINPPQAGILAVGTITRRPVLAEDGSVEVRELMNATLVCDHRIVYGADGARFLARVRELLEQPDALV
jgi:pyruvate dehydrogenase E2 component (dihydrolipoamide acetyltransferase)